jgi:hypothetical protein
VAGLFTVIETSDLSGLDQDLEDQLEDDRIFDRR